MRTKNNRSLIILIGLGLVFFLQIIWHMPGTIALRNSLLGIFAILTLGACIADRVAPYRPPLWPMLMIFALTAWIAVVNIFWADYPSLSWAEFRSQWMLPVLSFAFAWLFANCALRADSNNHARLLKVVFWAYLLQVVLHDVMGLGFYLETGNLPFRNAPILDLPNTLRNIGDMTAFSQAFSGQNPGFFSYVNAILSAILVAEIVQRVLTGKRQLPYSNGLLIGAVIAVLVCSYTLMMRNGNVGLLLLLFFAAIMVAYRKLGDVQPAKLIGICIAFLLGLGAMGYAFVKSDARWQGLADTVPYAWDTKAHKAWLYGEPYPVMPNGLIVEISAYERTAWLKEGLILLAERPLGSGYDRNAWGGRLVDKYQVEGKSRGGHSHNGILDFAVATGVPGVLLWLGFLASLAWVGFRAFKNGKAMEGLMLLFLVTGYFGRSMVDSVIRDHFLQVFMFLSGYFLALCQSATGPVSRDKSIEISIGSRPH